MSTITTLEDDVRHQFVEQWSLRWSLSDISPDPHASTALAILPQLVELVVDQPHVPVAEHLPVIHVLLSEQLFVDGNGDSVVDDRRQAQLESEVELIIDVLELMRRHQLHAA